MTALKVTGHIRLNYHTDTDTVSELLDMLPPYAIRHNSWKEYSYTPEVNFMIAHGTDCLFLKFVVKEKEIRAVNTLPQSPVWEDSCVEMFIQFREDGGYYNLEINCLGVMLAAYGADRDNRVPLPLNVLKSIRRTATINRQNEDNDIGWEMLLVIPLTSFIHDNLGTLTGGFARANFFKCGDKLADPHFLSWMPIDAPAPDFHLPSFFGRLDFAAPDK